MASFGAIGQHSLKPKIILLVEDSPDDAELAVRAFEKAGVPCHIVVARDGIQALDYLLAPGPFEAPHREVPSLVLLDLNLPRLDGLEVLRRLREDPRTRAVPVVVMSSSGQEEDVASSYRLGANAYVRKLVDYEDFVDVARCLGFFWLTLNRTPAPA
jgi:two-component system, response regulator